MTNRDRGSISFRGPPVALLLLPSTLARCFKGCGSGGGCVTASVAAAEQTAEQTADGQWAEAQVRLC